MSRKRRIALTKQNTSISGAAIESFKKQVHNGLQSFQFLTQYGLALSQRLTYTSAGERTRTPYNSYHSRFLTCKIATVAATSPVCSSAATAGFYFAKSMQDLGLGGLGGLASCFGTVTYTPC